MGSFGEVLVQNNIHCNNVERVKLGLFLDNMIFENHDERIFNILSRSDSLFKYKYSDGTLLVDKVIEYYKKSLEDNIEFSDYYSRVIFNILKKNEYRENKANLVIDDLRNFKSNINKSAVSKTILGLINSLCILNSQLSDNEKHKYKKIFMKKYDIKDGFSRSIEDVNDIKYCGNNIRDLRDKNIITMDHSFKAAYDDAISIEKLNNGNYLFGIYITDVSSFVGMDTKLYEHAKQRGESIYGDDKNKFYLPMFPLDMTKNFLSLNKGEDKYCIAYLFEFSNGYDLVSYSFCNALINVRKNYSFENINRMKSNDSNYDIVYLLSKLTDSLKSEFSSDYHSTKEKIKSNKKGYDNSLGSNIISTSTIFLNTFVAEMFANDKYPFIYRVNDFDVSTSLVNDSYLEKIVKGSTISSYSVRACGHPVNGYRPYGHITNPIRSFASYMNQYVFSNIYLGGYSEENKDEFCTKIFEMLPDIVDNLNDRLYRNQEFLDVYSELSGSGLRDFKKFKKVRKPVTRTKTLENH